MKWSEVKDMAVVSLADAQKIGFVDGAMLDGPAQRILGIRIRSGGMLTHRRALLLQDVSAIGADALTVEDPGRVNQESAFTTLKSATDIDDILGSKVMTEGGATVGTVADVAFDPKTGEIDHYLLGSNLLDRIKRREHEVPSSVVKHIGGDMLMVQDGFSLDPPDASA